MHIEHRITIVKIFIKQIQFIDTYNFSLYLKTIQKDETVEHVSFYQMNNDKHIINCCYNKKKKNEHKHNIPF